MLKHKHNAGPPPDPARSTRQCRAHYHQPIPDYVPDPREHPGRPGPLSLTAVATRLPTPPRRSLPTRLATQDVPSPRYP